MTAAACGDLAIQGVGRKKLGVVGHCSHILRVYEDDGSLGTLLGGLLVQNINCGARELGFAFMDKLPFLGQELREEAQVLSQPSPTTNFSHGFGVGEGGGDLVLNSGVWTHESQSQVDSQLTDI